MFAQDGDNLNGPHSTRSEEYVFQIVSDEELLSLLYVKEVNLRERFEKIIAELEGVKKDLIDHRGRASDSAGRGSDSGSREKPDAKRGSETEGDAENLGDLQTAIAVCAVRSLHQVRKNSVETASVEESFRGLLDELVNNAVHTQQMADRIGLQIVQPLHLANERDFPVGGRGHRPVQAGGRFTSRSGPPNRYQRKDCNDLDRPLESVTCRNARTRKIP